MKLIPFLFFIFSLSSCTSIQDINSGVINSEVLKTSGNSSPFSSYRESVTKFIFVPSDSEIMMNDSIILGKDEDWVGKLLIKVSQGIEITYPYIRDKYLNDGWNLKTTYRSSKALLIFEKSNRLITIDISEVGSIKKKSLVIFTVSNI